MLKRVWVLLLFILLALSFLLLPKAASAQSACTSLSGCTKGSFIPVNFPNLGCSGTRTEYNCSGTTCYQDSATCTTQQAVCNNPPSTGDNYNCVRFCTDLKNTPGNCCPDGTAVSQCGNPPAEHCTDYYNVCVNSYCVAAGDGRAHSGTSNYTCPSPQQCIAPPDAKAHQCVTPVVNPPTVFLTVNNVPALTVNKGDTYVLSWSTANSPTNCTAFGSWSWNLNSPPNNLSSGSTTDSKQDTGTFVYSLTCSNSAGSDTKSVSVNVNKTCPDYDSCSACVSQNSCGWKGDNNTCQTGTSSCPANTTAWFWTDCLTNMCVSGSSPATPAPVTTCTGSPACSVSAGVVNDSTVRGTVSLSGCTTGYELNTSGGSGRVNWLLNGSCPFVNGCTNDRTTADFSGLSCSTTQYTVTATLWSTATGKPQVSCTDSNIVCGGTGTPPPPATSTSTNLDCLYCGFGTASGVWVNKGEQSCNSGWNASGGICLDPGYTWACDRWGQTNNPQITVIPDLAASTSPPSRGTACKKPTTTTTGSGSTSSTGNIMGRFLLKTADSYYVIGNLNEQNHPLRSYFISVNPWLNTEYLNQSGFYLGPTSGSTDDGFEEGPYDCGGVCYQWTHNYNTTNAKIYVVRQDDALEVVGAIVYQRYLQYGSAVTKFEVCTGTNDRGQCNSWLQYYKTKCFGSAGTPVGTIGVGTKEAQPGNGGAFSLTPWASAPCSSTNGASCGPAPTSFTTSDFAGYKTTGPMSLTICKGDDCNQSYTAVPAYYVALSGANQQNIVQSCVQSATNNVVIDFVFIKKPLLSGLVCKDNNGDGSCITDTGTLRTCADGVYPSGTVTATKITTGPTPTFSRQVTEGGGYSMFLSSGDYNVGFSAPNVTLTSPALPRLISITADTIQDFCVNPTSAWLKTTGGDVHSNTSINTPGGP